MKIIKVKQSSNNFYKIKLENKEEYKVAEDIVVKYALFAKDKDIDEELLAKILDENKFYLALYDSFNYLSSIHSRYEVKMHLLKKYEKDIVAKVLIRLDELKLIDEKQYCLYMLDYAKRNKKGSVYLDNELQKQNIDKKIIYEVVEEYTDEMELEILDELLNKNITKAKGESLNSFKKKIYSNLIGRGFRSNNVIIILEKNISLLDNIIDENKALSYQYEKAYKVLSKKYDDKLLETKMINRLMQKGFSYNKIIAYMKEGK